jgi:UDP-N-acetylglucosamine 1-carboxyvinyltransferase
MNIENMNVPHYLIKGGTPLHGVVQISGAKNAVTKLMIASLLTNEPCTLRNVPLIGDFELTVALCCSVGSDIALTDHVLSITTSSIKNTFVETKVGGLNRMAIISIGPLLHRCGEADIPMPGGDRIGLRPLNFHIDGLQKMGAEIVEQDGRYHFSAPGGLHGATITLPFPSVMATENFLITASLAKGVTTIQNAALEPEIIDLIKFLQKMGAIIEIKVDRRIVIDGVERLHGASHTLLSDRNEAVSLAIAAYLTKGNVYLRGAQQDTLLTFLNTLSKMQLRFEIDDDGIRFLGDGPPPPAIALETDVHPGFMTDWQQPFTVLLTQAEGMSVVHETIDLVTLKRCKRWERMSGFTPSAWERSNAASVNSNTSIAVLCADRHLSRRRNWISQIFAQAAPISWQLYVLTECPKCTVLTISNEVMKS